MDAEQSSANTIREHLPWVKLTLDHTDKLAEAMPDDLLDFRPADPSGRFCFSLVELVKHVSDARIMFTSQLAGEEEPSGYWSEGPGEDGVWKFAEHKDREEVVSRLAESRQAVEHWLDQPASMLMEVTDGTKSVFGKMIERIKESGGPVDEWERRGPATINRVLMAMAVHEAGHRGTLQTLLRQKGINIEWLE